MRRLFIFNAAVLTVCLASGAIDARDEPAGKATVAAGRGPGCDRVSLKPLAAGAEMIPAHAIRPEATAAGCVGRPSRYPGVRLER
ncbi:hypothetical protein [Paludisphaera sp.]|uniref:hypothetical protein n=1 Tax=Paludisphaera sp. TaxID=2017432 RepID=UPI00301BA21E